MAHALAAPREDNVIKVNFSTKEIIQHAANKGIKEFAILLRGERPIFSSANPYSVKRELLANIRNADGVKELRKTRNGEIIVKTKNVLCAEDIINVQNLNGTQLLSRIAPNSVLSSFILRGVDIGITLTEILEEVTSHDITVVELRRLTKWVDGKSVPLKTIKVTHIGHYVPNTISICFDRHQPSIYVDRPRFCLKCFRYGHGATFCRSNLRCKRCGGDHAVDVCVLTEPTKCLNCSGSHTVDDIICPVRIKEEEILKLKAMNFLSYEEAKFKYVGDSKKNSFANVVKSNLNIVIPTNETQQISAVIKRMDDIEAKFTEAISTLSKSLDALAISIVQSMESHISAIFQKMNTSKPKTMENKKDVQSGKMGNNQTKSKTTEKDDCHETSSDENMDKTIEEMRKRKSICRNDVNVKKSNEKISSEKDYDDTPISERRKMLKEDSQRSKETEKGSTCPPSPIEGMDI